MLRFYLTRNYIKIYFFPLSFNCMKRFNKGNKNLEEMQTSIIEKVSRNLPFCLKNKSIVFETEGWKQSRETKGEVKRYIIMHLNFNRQAFLLYKTNFNSTQKYLIHQMYKISVLMLQYFIIGNDSIKFFKLVF